MDAAVYAATKELLASGNLSEAAFKAAVERLGMVRLVELIHSIGHFCTTAMMANVVGVEPPKDAISFYKA